MQYRQTSSKTKAAQLLLGRHFLSLKMGLIQRFFVTLHWHNHLLARDLDESSTHLLLAHVQMEERI